MGWWPYKETVRVHALRLTALAILLFLGGTAIAQEARLAVEQFVSRLKEVTVADMVVTQSLTIYDPRDSRKQVTGEQRLSIKLPARLRLETDVAGQREVRLLSGDRLVVQRGGKAFEAPPSERARQRAHTLFPLQRAAADLLREWAALGVRAEVAHTERVAGRAVVVFGALESDRTSPSVWLDPEYGVIRFITREEGADGPKLLDLAFSDHRKVAAGFFYPFRQEIFLNGKLLSAASVRAVEVNVGLADSLFDPDALLKGAPR